MAIAGSLTYDTKLETEGLQQGLNKISSSTVAIGNLMADAFKQVASAMGEVVKQGVTYNAQIEQYQVALTTLTGSAEEANRIMQQIKEDAAKTPFDVAGLTQANQLLISAGVDADDAREDIIALGNAISATGGGNEELSRMAVNLQQIKNVGQASALDIRQFAYAGIDLYGLLADYMGITKEEASELEITYEDLTGALKYASKEGGKYFGAMENQSKTLNGQISTLKDNFMTFAGEAAQPLFNFLKDTAIPILNQLIGGEITIEEAMPNLTQAILDFLTNTLNGIIEMLPQIIEIGIQVLISLANGISATLPELVPVIVNAIVLIIETLIDNIDLIIEAGVNLIIALTEGIFNALPDLIARLPELIIKLAQALLKLIFIQIPQVGQRIVITIIEGLFSYWNKMIEKVKAFFKGTIFEPIINKVADMGQAGLNLVQGLWNGILGAKDWLLNKIKGFATTITQGIKDFFGIASPSKVMAKEVGQWLPKGLAVGIDANTDSALHSIDKMNDEIMNKMSQAVNMETAKASFSGTSGSVSQILSANSVIQVENYNTLELDGEVVYENQQQVQQRKDLQYGFGGGTSK